MFIFNYGTMASTVPRGILSIENGTFTLLNSMELWENENRAIGIQTFSQGLDKVLGERGLKLSSVTELLGLPGAGKTQICLQLCASVQAPKFLSGLNGKALYIDTNTNFSLVRFKEIVHATHASYRKLDPNFLSTEEDMLNRLHYVNAFGFEMFCSFLHQLPQYLENEPEIKLIVIDSISAPYKSGIQAKQRTGLLYRQVAELHKLAAKKQIAVLLVNEMSTRVGLAGGSSVGAMGDAWAHRCNNKVIIAAEPFGTRVAINTKNTTQENTVAKFIITKDGIRDVN